MQRIERYGVIALVFLLVTIVAVSLWGEQRKAGGLFQFLRRESKSARVDRLIADAPPPVELPPAQSARTLTLDQRGLPLGTEAETEPLDRALNPPEPIAPPAAPTDPQPGESPFDPEPVPSRLPEEPRLQAVEPPPTAPAQPATYVIRKDDTLGEIAQRELGTARRLPELLAHNPGVDPRKIQPGQVIRLPPGGGAASAEIAQAAPQPVPETPAAPREPAAPASTGARRYTVRAGDTLGQIARRELGSVKRMGEILALNKGLEPNRVLAGTTLFLPVGEPAEERLTVALAEPIRREQGVPAAPGRSKVR